MGLFYQTNLSLSIADKFILSHIPNTMVEILNLNIWRYSL